LKYSLLWADKRAKKAFDSLPAAVRGRIKTAIVALADEPRPPGVKKLSGGLEGVWRVRIGDWRILYDIDDKAGKVILIDVGPRKSIYG
jgi:mRNA interferase RelE/StbE